MKKAHVVWAIAAVLIAGCGPAGDRVQASPAVVTVNGAPITVDRFRDRLKLLSLGFENRSGAEGGGADAKIDLLGQLIDEEMYLQEARRQGVSASASEIDQRVARAAAEYPAGAFEKTLGENGFTLSRYKEELGREITVGKLISQAVYSKVKVDRAQTLRYFKEHEKDFQRPLRVKARQIVVDGRDDALAILREIKTGADFQALARARSFSPDSASGGDLGLFSKGDMPPEFDAVIFHMKAGEVSPVVKTPYGYHIFKVEKVLPPERPSFKDAEAEARKRLAAELGEGSFEKWRTDLKARARVQVNFEVLGRL